MLGIIGIVLLIFILQYLCRPERTRVPANPTNMEHMLVIQPYTPITSKYVQELLTLASGTMHIHVVVTGTVAVPDSRIILIPLAPSILELGPSVVRAMMYKRTYTPEYKYICCIDHTFRPAYNWDQTLRSSLQSIHYSGIVTQHMLPYPDESETSTFSVLRPTWKLKLPTFTARHSHSIKTMFLSPTLKLSCVCGMHETMKYMFKFPVAYLQRLEDEYILRALFYSLHIPVYTPSRNIGSCSTSRAGTYRPPEQKNEDLVKLTQTIKDAIINQQYYASTAVPDILKCMELNDTTKHNYYTYLGYDQSKMILKGHWLLGIDQDASRFEITEKYGTYDNFILRRRQLCYD